jgi:hypothetical protein
MIHLDTNYLVGLLVKGSPQAQDVESWLADGHSGFRFDFEYWRRHSSRLEC